MNKEKTMSQGQTNANDFVGQQVMFSTGVQTFGSAKVQAVVSTDRGLLLRLDNGLTLKERQAYFVKEITPTA